MQWRRTGVPTFDVGSGSGIGGVIPLRFQYPANETIVNKANLISALTSLYYGKDDINAECGSLKIK